MRHERVVKPSLILGVTFALLLTGLVASPTLADQPTEWTQERVMEGEPNPCDPPNTQTVTLVFHVREHHHNNNVVWTVRTEASTDDGFSGFGIEARVVTDRTFRTTYNFIQTNPDTGQKFSVKGRFVQDLTTGEVLVEEHEYYCIRS